MTREDGNASKDARCGDRVLPQQATPTPTSGPAHNTSATRPMVTPTAAATVPQNSSHEETTTNTATLASTTLSSTAVTSTPTSSQITTPDRDKSTTTENSSGEDWQVSPNIQPTIAASDVAIILTSAIILVLLFIIVFIIWYYYKKMGEREKIDGVPPIVAVPPQQLDGLDDEGQDLNPQALQELNEQQALLPGMEHGEGELEPNDNEQARGEQNQRGVQIYVPTATGALEGQQFNLGVYQDQRCLFDARTQTVQLLCPNATVHSTSVHHHNFGSPEFVQIGTSNTINQSANTTDAANPESTDSEVTDS
ncbi:uncharacterized protein LOC118429945 [Branchiostoma floridae]|uniref:Uncharacterized protein LOC118429945 n=1 Tax=Branchiostoma floridae TaxID=7739 RepID=A0A9J7N9V6_BRAFL|nr:uncharacterized protein LOC118429945 [Branchiostoma floridae]